MNTAIQNLNGDFGDFSNMKISGYYWMSDKRNPVLVETPQKIAFELFDREKDYAFVVEAMFIDITKQSSLVIKTIDDQRFTYAIYWDNLMEYIVRDEIVPYVKDPLNKKLHFKTIYKKENIPTAEDFSTEVFLCRGFVGFKK